MADLTFTQGADPVTLVNDSSGNMAVITATGAVTVDGSAVTQPISGSVTTTAGYPTRAVYSTTIPTLIPVALATDVLVITGSATKTVRVLSIELFVTQTVASTLDWLLIRRSTDDSGGTPSSLTPRLHDTTDPAATAALREYLANPTLGTSAGIIARAKITAIDTATTAGQNGYLFDFIKDGFDKGIVLRGTSEILAVNLNGQTIPTGITVVGTITHSEE